MKISDFPAALSLLSSLYLCFPTRENLRSWRMLLAEDAPESLIGLKAALDQVDLSSERELADLSWDHTRLFVGPYKLPCPPWESVYTSPARLLMQESFGDVKQHYNKLGLEVQDPNVLPDHVGVELNYLAVLFRKMDQEPEKRRDYADLAQRFLEQHLMKWVPHFTGDMEQAAETVLYKALARATRDLLFSVDC